jgi:chromosome segregation ATPase
MKDGRLSYEKGPDGSFQIDLSELVRVFPDADVRRTGAGTRADAPNVHGTEHLNGFNALQALVQELKEDKTRLQRELDRAAEERQQLLAMLERQTEQVKLLTDERQQKERHSPTLWARLWRRQ